MYACRARVVVLVSHGAKRFPQNALFQQIKLRLPLSHRAFHTLQTPRHHTASISTRPGVQCRCSVPLPFSAVQLLNATTPCTCPCHSPLLPNSSTAEPPYECTETPPHPHPLHSSTYPHPVSRHPPQATIDHSFPHLAGFQL